MSISGRENLSLRERMSFPLTHGEHGKGQKVTMVLGSCLMGLAARLWLLCLREQMTHLLLLTSLEVILPETCHSLVAMTKC